MSTLRIACPSCKTVLQVGEQSFGKAVRCPKCQTVLKVPAAPAAPIASPPAKPPTAALLPSPVAPRPAVPSAAVAPKPAAPPPPRRASFAPPSGLAETPTSRNVPPPLLPETTGKGRSILPMLAIGALALVLAGSGTVVGLVLFAKMMGPGKPVPVADADKNGPGAPSTHPNDVNPEGNNPPSEGVKLAADYLADGFTGVVVLQPKRVLASDVLAESPQEQWFGSLAALSLDPRDADEAVVFLDPTPVGDAPLSGGVVARFGEKVNARLLKMSLPGGPQEKKYQDKSYFTPTASAVGPLPAVYFADDHTVVVASEATLKKMLSAKGAKNPLLDRLRTADHDNDVTAVVALDAMRSVVSKAVQQVPVGQDAPPAVRDGVALADQINAVVLTANLTKDPLLAVDVEAKDARTALAVLKVVHDGHVFLQDQYGAMTGGLLAGAPPDLKPLVDRFSGELNKTFTAKADGSHVRISVKRPASTKELIAKVGPILSQMAAAPPMVAANPPPPPPDNPPTPPREIQDIRKLGVDWVRDNNARGPAAGIVETVEKQLDEAVGFDKVGFVARYGAREMKSGKPTLLVGWNGDLFPLELTPEQGKQLGIQDNELGVTGIPAGADLGPGPERGELSGLKIDKADALDAAAPVKGTVHFHRLHPDSADEYYSLRLTVLGPKTRITLYQHLGANPLPKGDGELTLDFPALNGDKAGLSGPVPALVEVLAYMDSDRQGAAFVASNSAAALIVPAGK